MSEPAASLMDALPTSDGSATRSQQPMVLNTGPPFVPAIRSYRGNGRSRQFGVRFSCVVCYHENRSIENINEFKIYRRNKCVTDKRIPPLF